MTSHENQQQNNDSSLFLSHNSKLLMNILAQNHKGDAQQQIESRGVCKTLQGGGGGGPKGAWGACSLENVEI